MIKRLHIPLFYKECILAWQELLRTGKDLQSKKEVLDSIIWCNHAVKFGKEVIMDEAWARKSILRIRDIVDEQGNPNVEKIKTKVLNKAEVELKLNMIWKAIPKGWKTLIKSPEMTDEYVDTDTIGVMVGETWYDIHGLQSSVVQRLLVQLTTVKSSHEIKHEAEYGPVDWSLTYQMMSNNLLDRKVLEFQWKCINGAVFTEHKLQKMGVSNGMCCVCGIEEETLVHMLYDCETLGNIWQVVTELLKEIDEITIQESVLFFGCANNGIQGEKRNVADFLIFTTNWQLWKRRNIVKHENRFVNEIETFKMVTGHLRCKIEVLLKSKYTHGTIQHVMSKILSKLKKM